MKRPNTLLIMSDEHDPAVTACYGHPLVQTPNLDRLASDCLPCENAYCNTPICVRWTVSSRRTPMPRRP